MRARSCGATRCVAGGVPRRRTAGAALQRRTTRAIAPTSWNSSPARSTSSIALRERGCKLGIVTNGFAATHHEKVDRVGLRPYVDALFLADEMGMVKPDPEIFRHGVPHARQRAGPDGDGRRPLRPRHHRGGRASGLFTVLIDIHAIPLPEGARPPDAVVDTIADVLGVLPLGPGKGPLSGYRTGELGSPGTKGRTSCRFRPSKTSLPAPGTCSRGTGSIIAPGIVVGLRGRHHLGAVQLWPARHVR